MSAAQPPPLPETTDPTDTPAAEDTAAQTQ